MRKEVERARLIQKERLKESGICYNSQIPPGEISTYCKTSEEAEKMLQGAFEKLHLSGRACNRILRVARTAADLAGNEAEENISFEIVPEKTILEKAAAPIQKILSGKTEKEQKNRQGEKGNRYFVMLKWIVIGSIITILLIMTGVVLCRRKKDSAKEEQADEE